MGVTNAKRGVETRGAWKGEKKRSDGCSVTYIVLGGEGQRGDCQQRKAQEWKSLPSSSLAGANWK